MYMAVITVPYTMIDIIMCLPWAASCKTWRHLYGLHLNLFDMSGQSHQLLQHTSNLQATRGVMASRWAFRDHNMHLAELTLCTLLSSGCTPTSPILFCEKHAASRVLVWWGTRNLHFQNKIVYTESSCLNKHQVHLNNQDGAYVRALAVLP